MLSIRLIQLIQAHWEEIAARVIAEVRKHPETQNLAGRSDSELRVWCRDILENLESQVSSFKEDNLERRYRIFGRRRFEENIPLHEAVMRLQVLKSEIFNFVHEQGFTMTVLELYREEELQTLIVRFFDGLVYQVVRGYEDAQRLASRVA
jgi:hypothetical protein